MLTCFSTCWAFQSPPPSSLAFLYIWSPQKEGRQSLPLLQTQHKFSGLCSSFRFVMVSHIQILEWRFRRTGQGFKTLRFRVPLAPVCCPPNIQDWGNVGLSHAAHPKKINSKPPAEQWNGVGCPSGFHLEMFFYAVATTEKWLEEEVIGFLLLLWSPTF